MISCHKQLDKLQWYVYAIVSTTSYKALLVHNIKYLCTVRERVRQITGASSLGENMGASSLSEHRKCSETKSSSSANENIESTLADNNTTCSEDIISHL